MPESQNLRLDRIEEKLDKLGDAMISIARTEEKMLAMEQKYAAHYERMNRFSEKLDSIEKIVQQNTNTVYMYNKIIAGSAAVITAVGAWVIQYFI